MAKQRFEAELRPSGRGGGGHLVEVPPDVIAALGGGGRIPVSVTFNGIPYRGSIVRMGGVTCIGVLTSIIDRAGVSVGDRLEVVVERDEAPREIVVPEELMAAIRSAKLLAAWDALSFTHRKGIFANAVAEAKKPETRERRIQQALSALRERGSRS